MHRRITSLLAAATLAIAMSGAAFAASTAWMRVIIVKTDNVSSYLAELNKARAMSKRLGITTQIRAWRATYAGPNAGMLVVTVESPSWSAFAESQAKTAADPEFSAWVAGLDKIRTIVSDSLYREL